MARADDTELIDQFEEFYRSYYRNEIGELAQKYPSEQKSLYVDWQDLYRFDPDIADDFRNKPNQLREYAEEALRLYDLPVDVSLGQAHVRVRNLPEATDIRAIRADHRGMLISVQGIIRKATDVRPKVVTAAFECQRCGTLTRIPQESGDFQEPHECQGCERQGPFRINYDQSEFIDAQKLRVQESPEGLRGGETPQSIDVNIEDDITGEVTAGDHVTVTGILRLEQQGGEREKSPMFDVYMEGLTVDIEDEQFEEMDITDEDKKEIVELSNEPDIYEQMEGAIAPSIYGYEMEKRAMAFQLFSGVTKFLPDESRTRGDIHVLLIGDPGTGKCIRGDERITLGDGSRRQIRDVVEKHLTDPRPVDDGVYDTVEIPVPSLTEDGQIRNRTATKVWKREAPEQMYRIRTTSGHELEVTPSHPLFVQSESRFVPKRAEELDEDDFIATPRRIETTEKAALDVNYRPSRSPNAVSLELPETWIPSLARLLGYIIAEGHVESNEDNTASVRITNEDDEILRDITEAYEQLGLPYTQSDSREDTSASVIRCTASEFVSFLEHLEPNILERSAKQRVPEQILTAGKRIQAEFLRAYVESEGHVSATQRGVTVASTSRQLLDGVRSLLLSFGIEGQIHSRSNGSYRLRISGKHFERYVRQVGFITGRKEDAATKFDQEETNTNTNIVPGLSERLREIRETLALTQHDCGIPRTTYQHYERGDRDPGREGLATVATAFENHLERLRDLRNRVENGEWDAIEAARKELSISQQALADRMEVTQTAISHYERKGIVPDGGHTADARTVVLDRIDKALAVEGKVTRLRTLAETDVGWDRIASIETVEPDDEWVYDLEVEGTHNYISEGILSHNSALLQYIDTIAPRSVFTSGKGASAAGLCVTGDTLVHTEEGFREIREIVEEKIPNPVESETGFEQELPVCTFDRKSDTVDVRDTSHVWRMPEKPCRQIETSHGKELEASVDTPVLTCGEHGIRWTEISDISRGDYVAVPEHSQVSNESFERQETDVQDLLDLTTEKIKLDDDSLAQIRDELQEEFGTLRDAAAALELSEDFLYDTLSNRHVPLDKLDVVLDSVGLSREDIRFDRVMIRHGDSITLPDSLDEGLMYLLGIVFGDGDISYDRRDGNRGCIRVSNSNEALLERVIDIVERKFDKEVHIEYQEEKAPCVRIHSATIARLFANAGMETPKESLSLHPKLTTARHADAFLRGLMDADGSVSARTNGRSSVLLSTISRTLARQVQLMLETYGVRARTRERDRRGKDELEGGQIIESKHIQHFIEIYGADIERFASAIGFTSTPKQKQLQTIVGDATRRGETMPIGSALAAADGSSSDYHTYLSRGDNPGRDRAQAMLEDIDLGDVRPMVQETVDADLRWDEVVATAETGEKEVFDLTVPETHNFVGNGIVTHNTAAAVRDDFGEGQQWTLEAGALVLADKGVAAVDELDKMSSQDQSAMHQALEEQSYHPKTEVLTSDGRRVEIGDLVDNRMANNPSAVVDGVDCEILPVDDMGVHTVDLATNDVEKTGLDRVSRHEAPDEFVRVEFSNGREVLVTPDHPMFVADEGIRTVDARNIEEGAFVPAPRKLPNSTETVQLEPERHIGKEKHVDLPDTLTPDLGEILGFLVSEGHTRAGSSHEIGFSNQDGRLLDRMERLMASVFGMESSEHTNAAGTVTKVWVSTKLYRWFESNVPEVMPTAREKRIPSTVLGSSEEVIRRFLVGAFAGDGGVESNELTLSTASSDLAQDYADALLKLGVASRIHYDSSHDSWKVCVMGDSTEQFVDMVVQRADERYEQTRELVKRGKEIPRHHDVLPTGVAHELRALRKLLGLRLTGRYRPTLDEGYGVRHETVEEELATLRERIDTVRTTLDGAEGLATVRAAIGWSCRQLSGRLDGVSGSNINYAEQGGYDTERRRSLADRAREAVQAALEAAEQRIGTLEQRLELRYYRVTNVETVPNDGEFACEWVYDVTVEPTNTFVGQGVVLHNSISISKAGINATLKSRCSLLGAANPTYGRFDQYEPIGEQIDLEPPLISRFDLIFTVTDEPDEEDDAELAEHILQTNYAGELNTHREEVSTSNYSREEVEQVTEEVAPTIEPELLRKYVAYAKRNCYPTMTEEAKAEIQEFYVGLRAQGTGEDAPVPVTARKLEALVRLSEASARVRLSDTVEREDAKRAIEIAEYCLKDIGLDPETGELDADVVETGTSKSQRDRIKSIKNLIADIEAEYDEGAPVDIVIERAEEAGMDADRAEHEIDKLKEKGEVYMPKTDHLRTT
ncbi:MAG: LAGLIDADG family homing endonuclease [Halovenus sp.]